MGSQVQIRDGVQYCNEVQQDLMIQKTNLKWVTQNLSAQLLHLTFRFALRKLATALVWSDICMPSYSTLQHSICMDQQCVTTWSTDVVDNSCAPI